MKVVFLTAGTGTYYCGACMRDNALAKALVRGGHEAVVLPLYLPLKLDEAGVRGLEEEPVRYGGVSVWLQERFSFFREIPLWLNRLLSGKRLLRAVAKRSHLTSASEQGELAWLMLSPESGGLVLEAQRLMERIVSGGKPDLVVLSNALLTGMARELKRCLGVRVVGAFQGEDSFLDGLAEPWRERCWEAMGERVRDCDGLMAASRFDADFVEGSLGLERGSVEVIANGIETERWVARVGEGEGVRIGYFARLCEEKGLRVMVEAFIYLRRGLGDGVSRLVLGGSMAGGDDELVRELKVRLEEEGLTDEVEWHVNPSWEGKVELMRSFSIFSVPAVYREPFGLYVLEAMASGLPIVQPRASAFPEILGECAVYHEGGDAFDLARRWAELIEDGERRVSIGLAARRRVEEEFDMERVCGRYVSFFQKFV